MPEQHNQASRRHAERLFDLLGLGEDDGPQWGPDELAAIFRHQMSAPVLVDLGGFEPQKAARLRVLTEAQGLLVRSFADLFRHPSPPLELLRLTKDFAKANLNHPEALLPPEIATVLYYASLAAALVKRNERITRLSNADLREGLTRAVMHPWLDEETKQLLIEALRKLPPAHGS
jgi:hypothetical protein